MVPGGRVGGRADWEAGIDADGLRYIKSIPNKDLLYSAGSSARYSAIT